MQFNGKDWGSKWCRNFPPITILFYFLNSLYSYCQLNHLLFTSVSYGSNMFYDLFHSLSKRCFLLLNTPHLMPRLNMHDAVCYHHCLVTIPEVLFIYVFSKLNWSLNMQLVLIFRSLHLNYCM